MKKTILTFGLLFIAFILKSQTFENLSSFKNSYGAEIKYDAQNSQIIDKEIGDEYKTYQVIKTKIDNLSDKQYLIEFDPGPSVDPSYRIYLINGTQYKLLGQIYTDEILIPGTKYIYSKGIMNNNFEKRKKFEIKGDSISEVKQPFYYVGLKTKTRKATTLYLDKNQKKQVAMLPPQYEIEVLICDEDYYLIKTAFGLTGWAYIPQGLMYPPNESQIEGLYYNGD